MTHLQRPAYLGEHPQDNERKVWQLCLVLAHPGEMYEPFVHLCMLSRVRLWDPMDCNWSGFSVRGISQARILEWVAISSFRGSYWPRDWTLISYTGRRILIHPAYWETPYKPFRYLQIFPEIAHLSLQGPSSYYVMIYRCEYCVNCVSEHLWRLSTQLH